MLPAAPEQERKLQISKRIFKCQNGAIVEDKFGTLMNEIKEIPVMTTFSGAFLAATGAATKAGMPV